MGRDERRIAYFRVIDRLWNKIGRVTHKAFAKALKLSRTHMKPKLRRLARPLTPRSFTYFLQLYCRQHRIRRRTYAWIRAHLLKAMESEEINPDQREKPLLDATRTHLIKHRVVVPGIGILRRLVLSARTEIVGRRPERKLKALEQALGIVLKDMPLVKQFQAAQKILRYPPTWQGKANLQTMAREAKIQAELEEVIHANALPKEKMLNHPQLTEYQNLIERLYPAFLYRREKKAIVAALPFYVVGRWRDARDTVLTCFVRKARLLRYNLKNLYETTVRDASLAFLEKSTLRFRSLHRAVLKSLETGSVGSLRRQRKFLKELNRKGIRFASKEDYYRLLSGRGGYVRKMARRLASISFVGQDTRARAVIAAMEEVCRFKPFRVRVPKSVVENLGFLNVPSQQLRRRKIFEPVVLMTMADLLWSGRVTVSGSLHFRNRWEDLPPQTNVTKGPNPTRWVAGLRRRLETAGKMFRQRTKGSSVIQDGKLKIPKSRQQKKNDSKDEDKKTPSTVLKLPTIDIVDLLWEVHEATGFLDAFQLEGPAPHRLSDEERRRLAIAVSMGMGLNLGLQEISRSSGRGYKRGRLRNFAANYVTVKTLREALFHVNDTWYRLGLGRPWGSGTSSSVDGRAVYSYAQNLLSQYHYRKGRVGVTIYWIVRDDYLASSIRIIGNQEWESWYILDDLLNPIGGNPLEVSTGDTHGQHLAAWGLSDLLDKQMTVRFRQLKQVKIYGPKSGRWCRLKGVGKINWKLLRKAAPSLHRLKAAVESGAVVPSEILRTWNLYDENGVNIGAAIRELGKVKRTEFIFTYAIDPALRERIQRGCQRTETWNSFQEAVFFGKGGRIETNNPLRRDEIGLAMALILNSIVFYNAWKWGSRLKKIPSSTPIVWNHVRLLGRYRITKRVSSSRKRHKSVKNLQ